MSYILDALQKSQQERHLGQVPTLGTPALPATIRRRGPWAVVAAIFGVATVMAGGFGLALLTGQVPGTGSGLGGEEPPLDATNVALAAADPPRPVPERPPASPNRAETAPVAQRTGGVSTPAPDAPLLAELTPEARSALPGFELNVHIHSPDPRGRFVFLNNSRYREGERTREGARVEAITQAGVVIDYNGTRFRLGL